MRALEPHGHGLVTNPRDGVRIAWESFGPPDARRVVVLLPTWSVVHSRIWKLQVPFLAHHGFRVVTFDGRGNGKSDRPASGYTTHHFAQDTLAVLDALGIQRASLVGYSAGGRWGIQVAADHPERVERLVLIAPAIRFGESAESLAHFHAIPPDREGFNKYTAVHWREDYPDFLDWFFATIYNEGHSTKQIEDAVGWGLETTPEVLVATIVERTDPPMTRDVPAAIRCPALVIHGDRDEIISIDLGRAVHDVIPNSRMVTIEGAGHAPHTRDPVKVNQLLLDFIGEPPVPERRWRRAMARKTKRALFVSSPIGLGHIQRDVAIARELRALVPGLEVDWLAQHPATTVLEAHGECIHPRSADLAGESPHIESEMDGEHHLNIFRAWRNMDEILLANAMHFFDVAREGSYDLWIGDEAWEVDYYLHENPELKAAPFVWLTDFVGWLPMAPDPGGCEARLTADYNAEMIEQVARFPWTRDASLFIGNPRDIVPGCFGDGLPLIREWTEANFDFTGYVRYSAPTSQRQREELRRRFGFGPDERVAVASVGGTSVGSSLLRRLVHASQRAREAVPNLRMVVVCGPRIDPAEMPRVPGVEYLRYVHNLYEMLTACDIALVQGGLATTMELVVAGTPFLSFPLRGHCEQQRHVAYRLGNYGVPDWSRLQYEQADPEIIAERLLRLIDDPPAYGTVEADGARLAAERIAALI